MKWRGWALAVLAIVATVAPVVRSKDGFPLSNYPMFIVTRPDVTTFESAVGSDPNGRLVRLSPKLVAGSVEVIQAVATVENAVANDTAQQLCLRIAARVAESDEFAEVQSVSIITETYDIIPALVDGAAPVDVVEHARCAVDR